MLDHPAAEASSGRRSPSLPAAHSETVALTDVLAFLKSYARTIGLAAAVAVLIAGYLAVTATPIFTATAEVLIDPRISEIQREQAGEVAAPLDTAQIESQLALLRSEGIARSVINSLDLTRDTEFQPRRPSVVGRILGVLRRSSAEPTPDQNMRTAILALQSRLDVVRVGISYGIRISFGSEDPTKAARIANAIANIYVRDQIETRSRAAQAGSLWLEEKISVIRQKMNAAARASQEFKASHDYRLTTRPDKPTPGTVAEAAQNAHLVRRDASITLDELESTAQTYRKLYESYLLAYTEALQRDSYPVSNARVISTALPPTERSHPRTQLMLLFAAVAGTLAGIGLALVQSGLPRPVRSAAREADAPV